MRKLTFLFFFFLSITTVFSQQKIAVKGKVTDNSKQPLPGVTIVLKGTTQGTVTNADGNYTLTNIPVNAQLKFSFVGMKSQEVAVGSQTTINVEMAVDAFGIEEVVAIGYGTSRAADLTAPISTVNSDVILRNVNTNAISSIQGSIPGIQVTNRGEPGSGPDIRVRGIGSMSGAQPLYVVDGMFYGNIDWLSPNDIQSMSVLKDASSAAIYGVRASGGVVMITTKKGKINQGMVIEYDGYTGINSNSNLVKMTNTEQYSTMLIEAGIVARLAPSVALWGGRSFTHDGAQYTIPTTDTDWYGDLLGKHGGSAQLMNHSLSLRGGSQTSTYHVGASYASEDGLFKNTDHKWERINLRASLNFNPYKFLDLGVSFNINHNKTQNTASIWEQLYFAVPTIPALKTKDSGPTDFAGAIAAGFTVGPVNNPAAILHYTQGNFNFSKDLNLDYSAFANIKFLGDDRLVFRTQFSHRVGNGFSRNYTPVYLVDDKLRNDVSSLNKGASNSSLIHLDHTLTFQDQFGDHGLTAMAGFSTRQFRSRSVGATARTVPGTKEEYLYFFNAVSTGTENFSVSDGGSTEVGVSFFGRLMYNYKHKYLLNATFRGDGTDKYSQTWGYFPSVGIGWVLSEEPFMKEKAFFDYLKLRASWGQLGNNNVARESGSRAITTGFSYSYIFNDVIVPGYAPSIFFNRLKWEVTEETGVGVEGETLNSRLGFEIDWFRKVTRNAAIATSNLMGAGSLVRNQGEILNTGWEFTLKWRDKIGNLGYSVSANLATLRNEVLSLGGQPYIVEGSAEFPVRTQPGHELYSWYGYKVIGVYQDVAEIQAHINTAVHTKVVPGDLKLQDVNNDKLIDFNDKQFLGANIPNLTYGAQLDLDYKGFDFSTSVYGVTGNTILNRLRAERGWHSDFGFDLDLYKNRWTGPGTSNTYPSAKGMISAWNMNSSNSFLTESGSYFRIQNISLGYTIKNLLPGSNAGSKIRIRLTAQNPFTWFAFNGFTPEVTGVGEARGVTPIPTSYIMGINITY
jgi:TonB-linked SusC/RagA family outer membrane protein